MVLNVEENNALPGNTTSLRKIGPILWFDACLVWAGVSLCLGGLYAAMVDVLFLVLQSEATVGGTLDHERHVDGMQRTSLSTPLTHLYAH